MSTAPSATPAATPAATTPATTADASYAARLSALATRGGALRRVLDPQRPYRWNLRHLHPGFTLDVGCGIGRNLGHLDGNGVGVDHNAECVALCRSSGFAAYSPEEFVASDAAQQGGFDSLLLAHVVEHLGADETDQLVSRYLPYVRPGGRVIVITPQERGQASDVTHVRFVDESQVREMAQRLGLSVDSVRSFPLPRVAGRFFTYNETVAVLLTMATV